MKDVYTTKLVGCVTGDCIVLRCNCFPNFPLTNETLNNSGTELSIVEINHTLTEKAIND